MNLKNYFYKISETAKILRVTPATVRKYIKTGKLGGVDFSPEATKRKHLRITKESLARLLEESLPSKLPKPRPLSRNEEILQLYHKGRDMSDIARQFRVSDQRIAQIIQRFRDRNQFHFS